MIAKVYLRICILNAIAMLGSVHYQCKRADEPTPHR